MKVFQERFQMRVESNMALIKAQQVLGALFLFLLSSISAWAQTCNSAMPFTAPDTRYTINSIGTVTDLHTGLMWQQCSAGLSGADCADGVVQSFKWDQALQHVENLNATTGFANYTDWRLPNIKELVSLVEEACDSPAINLNHFPNTTHSKYWSSSPLIGQYTTLAWYVRFYDGYSHNMSRSSDGFVRLVRIDHDLVSLIAN